MNRTNMRNAFCLATIAAACFLVPHRAQAQESWNSGRGSGASSWGGASATAKMPMPQKPGSGSASWKAGSQNFGSARQAGGVWHDGSVPFAGTYSSTPKSPAAGTPTAQQPWGLPGFSSAPVFGGAGLPKTLVSHAATGLHTSSSQHFGGANGGRTSPLRSSGARSVAFHSRSSSIEGFRTSTGSSPGAMTLNPPELQTQQTPSLLPELPDSGATGSQLH